MYLTDFQKELVKQLGNGELRFVNDFVARNVQLYSEEEKLVKIQSHNEINRNQRISENSERPIVVDKYDSREKVKSFYTLIEKLKLNNLILLVEDSSRSSNLIPLMYISSGKHAHPKGTLLEDLTLTNILRKLSNVTIIPIVNFSIFIKDYLTDEEREAELSRLRSEKSLKYSRNALFVTTGIAVLSMFINIAYYSTNRTVTIANAADTVYVKITNHKMENIEPIKIEANEDSLSFPPQINK